MIWRNANRGVWNPWGELSSLHREVDRLFRDVTGWPGAEAAEFPAVNIWTNEDQALLTAEIPGVDPKELDITVKDNAVTIKGSRDADPLKEGEVRLRQERGVGAFARTFTLPFKIDGDHVKADCNHGILELTMPRAEADKPKRIAVKTEA